MSAPAAARRELWIGFLCAAAIVAIWCGFIVLSRVAAKTSFTPYDLMALRFGVAGPCMVPLLLLRGSGGLRLWQIGWLALTAGLGFSFLAFTGFSHAPAAHGAVLMPGTLPLYTALLAWLFLGESLTARRLLGLVLIVGGIALVMSESWAAGHPSESRLMGDLCFTAASCCWAMFTVAARKWRVEPFQAAAAVVVPAMLLVLPVYATLPGQRLFEAGWGTLLFQGVYQGLLATLASLVLFTRAVRALGAARTAIATSVTPTLATLLAIPLAGELPSAANLAGLALATAGMVVGVGGAATPRGSPPRR